MKNYCLHMFLRKNYRYIIIYVHIFANKIKIPIFSLMSRTNLLYKEMEKLDYPYYEAFISMVGKELV